MAKAWKLNLHIKCNYKLTSMDKAENTLFLSDVNDVNKSGSVYWFKGLKIYSLGFCVIILVMEPWWSYVEDTTELLKEQTSVKMFCLLAIVL